MSDRPESEATRTQLRRCILSSGPKVSLVAVLCASLGLPLCLPLAAAADQLSGSPQHEFSRPRYFTGASPIQGATLPKVTFKKIEQRGRSLGFQGKLAHPGEILSLNYRETYNHDLLDRQRIITDWQLDQKRNWRREAGFSLKSAASSDVRFKLDGGLYDVRRPTAVQYPHFASGYPDTWVEHRSTDLALELGLFGDRLRYSGGYARSRYAGTSDYRAVDRRPDPWSFRDTGGTGEAQRHRIDGDLLSGDSVTLSAYALQELADPGFRLGTRSEAPPRFARGELTEYGGNLRADGLEFSVTQRERQARGRHQTTLHGKMGVGQVKLGLFQDSFKRGSGLEWLTQENSIGGSIEVDLDELRPAGSGGFRTVQLMPSSIAFGLQRGTVSYLRAPQDPPDSKRTLSLSLGWDWERATSTLSAYRSDTRSSASNTYGDNASEFGVDLSHSFSKDAWVLTTYLSAGGYAYDDYGRRSRDQWVVGGVALAYSDKEFPDFSLALDIDRFDGQYPAYDERYGEQTGSFDIGLDFSKFFGSGAEIKVNYFALYGNNLPPELGGSGEIIHALGAFIGFEF